MRIRSGTEWCADEESRGSRILTRHPSGAEFQLISLPRPAREKSCSFANPPAMGCPKDYFAAVYDENEGNEASGQECS
jgi:hypothetical protein